MQREVESSALIGGTLGPDLPAVAVNDALHCGQADPGAFKIACVMEPLEGPEQAVGIRHVESGAVVPNEACPLAVILGQPELDPGFFLLPGVLPRIAEKVYRR